MLSKVKVEVAMLKTKIMIFVDDKIKFCLFFIIIFRRRDAQNVSCRNKMRKNCASRRVRQK